jgi:hypothetical protein
MDYPVRITRDLPVEEWHRLEGHPALQGHTLPDPLTSRAIITEENNEIVGVWFAIQVIHIEPVWIREDQRKGWVPIALYRGMRRLLDSCSLKSVFSFSETAEVSSYLTRLGFKTLPYKVHLWEV